MAAASFDFAVIGGGLVGAAIACGLCDGRRRVALLDEGDIALRASRGNFALVWVQSKGLGMPDYAGWTRRSSDAWQQLASELKGETGIDVAFSRSGGFTLCLSEAEMQARLEQIRRLHNQSDLPYEVLDHAQTRQRLPQIGPGVVGSVFCPLDGHVNSLRLLRALHLGVASRGGAYLTHHGVSAIETTGGGFRLHTPSGAVEARRIVLAAGLGNAALAPMAGLSAPVRPLKGEIVVTERTAPFLHHPIVNLRQTDEGGVMIGDSQEESGDLAVRPGAIATMAARAVAMFPHLAGLNVVRSWAALRVMTPDGFPVYQQSPSHPGAFLAICHSGVTLAAAHALHLAPMLAAGALDPALSSFSARRFDVPTAA
ncbi:MAG: NAD(P)/FAD-dependent oxidoreductase [Reyranellaceae bacterium]